MNIVLCCRRLETSDTDLKLIRRLIELVVGLFSHKHTYNFSNPEAHVLVFILSVDTNITSVW